ncbi:P-loop containing nucleoside triphosphate hydrolase protein [Ochromonadaceae sp. CCMP2298]|nr:P-loop containing nucleoside triphosphate hydrolase protein [Ochromonadaceae sp. CCMP2298]
MSAVARFRQRTGSEQQQEPITDEWLDGNIKVFVRKRPIFKRELDGFEFDVATCTTPTSCVIHDARMHIDMKRQLMNHHQFRFDRVFNEHSSNEAVYAATARSLVRICCEGGYSTCLVYGQTGSGKTFTMSSIYEQAAFDIFTQLESGERFASPPSVSMSFVEIAGDACHDLLNAFTPAQLLTGQDGSVYPFPVTEPTVTCPEELIAMIQHGTAVRTTAATGVHDASSRSHAILRVYVQRHDLTAAAAGEWQPQGPVEGTLTLVDLAGSEHRIDSMYHGKERRKETGNINASLMALKECIRARTAGQIQPHHFRRSKLTLALKHSFSLPAARTIVIATVSPASKDTEHSLNTLRHACIMHGQEGSSETRFVTGGSVTTEHIGEVNLTQIGRQNASTRRAGGAIADPKTQNGNNTASSAATAANSERELTEKERGRLRRQAEHRYVYKTPVWCTCVLNPLLYS